MHRFLSIPPPVRFSKFFSGHIFDNPEIHWPFVNDDRRMLNIATNVLVYPLYKTSEINVTTLLYLQGATNYFSSAMPRFNDDTEITKNAGNKIKCVRFVKIETANTRLLRQRIFSWMEQPLVAFPSVIRQKIKIPWKRWKNDSFNFTYAELGRNGKRGMVLNLPLLLFEVRFFRSFKYIISLSRVLVSC